MIIKRWNGSGWVRESPEVNLRNIVDPTTGYTSIFDSSNKLSPNYLPAGILDNLKLVTTMTSNSPQYGHVKTLVSAAVSKAETERGSYKYMVGYYWIASSSVTLDFTPSITTTTETEGTKTFKPVLRYGDSDGNASNMLESNDWIVISELDLTRAGTAVDPYRVIFDVVNNTYEEATDQAAGIVKLADPQYSFPHNFGDLAGGTGVINENTLYKVLNNNFSTTSHKHGGIDKDGKIGTVANKVLTTTTGGLIEASINLITGPYNDSDQIQQMHQGYYDEYIPKFGAIRYWADQNTAPIFHSHGYITSTGTLDNTETALATGDGLIITKGGTGGDAGKLMQTTLKINTATNGYYLSEKGTWSKIQSADKAGTIDGIVRFNQPIDIVGAKWGNLADGDYNPKALTASDMKTMVERYVYIGSTTPGTAHQTTNALWFDISA